MNYAETIRAKCTAMEEIINKAKNENRPMNDTEKAVYNDMKAEVENLEASLKAEEELKNKKEELKKAVAPTIFAEPKNHNEKKWKNFGEFLGSVRNAYAPGGSVDQRLTIQNATGMSIGVASDGGFSVDQQFINGLQSSMIEMSELMGRITIIPTGEGYGGIKMPALDETSRADGSRWGGVRAYWASEAGTATATKPKMRKIDLSLEKLLAFVYTTDELLTDSVALENYVKMAYADEMSFKLNDAIINGDGIGRPLGILNSSALVSVTKETGQAADTVVYENVLKMYSRMPARHRRNAVWLINQEVEPQLATMSIAVGVGGVPVYMPAGGASVSPFGTLFGRPVIPMEQCSKLGDAGDIIFTDLSAYIGTEKGGLQVDSSIHVQFLYDEQCFRFRYRFNGTPYYNSTVQSYKNAATTYSPYVTLGAR